MRPIKHAMVESIGDIIHVIGGTEWHTDKGQWIATGEHSVYKLDLILLYQ